MNKLSIAATALALTLVQPASAITFSKLTTIYVGSGVIDSGNSANTGLATSIHCSNVSGAAVQVRSLVLRHNGTLAGSLTASLSHGATFVFSTHLTVVFNDDAGALNTQTVAEGALNVEATNSAVFCTAVVVDAQNFPPVFMSPLHLVRVNPHPGTVE